MSSHPTGLPASRIVAAGLGLALALALAAAVADPPRAAAQASRAGWRTHAGGDEILALAIDPNDPERLWAGTEGGGVVWWDLAHDTFVQHVFPTEAGLVSNDVYDIAFDDAGNAWLATGRGVTLAPTSGAWTPFPTDDIPDEGLPDPPLTAVVVDPSGDVWAGGPHGLAHLTSSAADWTFVPVDAFEPGDDDQPKDGPGQTYVADLAIGPDGRVYVAHGRGKSGDQPALSVFDPAGQAWRHTSTVDPATGGTDGPTTDQVMALASHDGQLWLGTWGKGVLRWDGTAWEAFDKSFGLCDNRVWAITADDDGVWAACANDRGSGAGIAAWNGTDWEAHGTADGLPDDALVALAATADRVYVGTNGTGVDAAGEVAGAGIVPFDGAAATALRTAPRTPWSNDITAAAFAPDGTLWAGTRGSGLMRYAPQDQAWTVYTVESTDGDLAGDTITDLVFRGNELWISAAQTQYRGGQFVDGGVSVLEHRTERWVDLIRKPTGAGEAGLPDNNVSSLAVDGDGQVWFGLGSVSGGLGLPSQSGAGVAALDPSTARWERFDSSADGLAGDTVTDVAAGGDTVWVAASYHTGAQGRREGGGVSRLAAGAWDTWARDDDGFLTYHGSGVPTQQDPFIAGDVRAVAMTRAGEALAGTYTADAASLIGRWPFVDAVVNQRAAAAGPWTAVTFVDDGWVSALAEDTRGQVWAGTTRGHFYKTDPFHEHSPSGNRQFDTAIGGAHVRTAGGWITLEPGNSGLASNAVTALAVDPTNGHVWLGTENGGFSVYTVDQAQPTPSPGGPTATAARTATASPPGATGTVPAIVTIDVQATRRPGTPKPGDDEEDDGAPPEVPEPGSLLILGSGLAGLAGYLGWRRRGTR